MNCDWIAPYYRWFEYLGFGRELERRRCSLLPEIASARHILALGDGDGRFIARLSREFPSASIDSVEASARMLALARRRTQPDVHHMVHHIRGDARTLVFDRDRYDLIVTHFFLDCFDATELPIVIERVSSAATLQAQWLISEFRQAPRGWRAWWSSAWITSLYLFFRAATGLRTRALVDHHPFLAERGFRLAFQETSRFGLLASELWERTPN